MPFNSDYIPETIQEAVDILYSGLNRNEEQVIKEEPAIANHFSGGMAMRNNWKLWLKDTPIKRDAVKTYRIAHADDLSGLITDWLWAKERGEHFDPVKYCDRFHEHWNNYGMTALEAGGYNNDGSPMTEEEQIAFAQRIKGTTNTDP